MAMHDSVYVQCPQCLQLNELESQSGPCLLGRYTLEGAPEDVMQGIQIENCCEHCSVWFRIKPIPPPPKYIVEVG